MVEGARLEILCTPCGYRGFKSLPLRQFNNTSVLKVNLQGFLFLPPSRQINLNHQNAPEHETLGEKECGGYAPPLPAEALGASPHVFRNVPLRGRTAKGSLRTGLRSFNARTLSLTPRAPRRKKRYAAHSASRGGYAERLNSTEMMRSGDLSCSGGRLRSRISLAPS